ncbi:MAG: Alpha-aminoadipate--LysW ligase LysX [Syntrophomonadaceae bacterium]|nr:Alpha-aminoadipate--LysW ligase LysX [Bacillota bacterium]
MRIGILSQARINLDLQRFTRAAVQKGVHLSVLHPRQLILKIRREKLYLLDTYMRPVQVDAMINWAPCPEFLEIEQACRILRIPFVNSTEAVRRARNKMLTSLILCEHDLPQPETAFVNEAHPALPLLLPVPLVFKPKSGTTGQGAKKIETAHEYRTLLMHRQVRQDLYLQSYVPNGGWDLRVVVIGRSVLGAIKKTARQGEWRTHVAYGGKVEPCQLESELEQLALRVAEVLGLSITGLDIMIDKTNESYQILEANAVPGLKIFEEATGISVAQAILDHMISLVKKNA